jgi:hypothetical protein
MNVKTGVLVGTLFALTALSAVGCSGDKKAPADAPEAQKVEDKAAEKPALSSADDDLAEARKEITKENADEKAAALEKEILADAE